MSQGNTRTSVRWFMGLCAVVAAATAAGVVWLVSKSEWPSPEVLHARLVAISDEEAVDHARADAEKYWRGRQREEGIDAESRPLASYFSPPCLFAKQERRDEGGFVSVRYWAFVLYRVQPLEAKDVRVESIFAKVSADALGFETGNTALFPDRIHVRDIGKHRGGFLEMTYLDDCWPPEQVRSGR